MSQGTAAAQNGVNNGDVKCNGASVFKPQQTTGDRVVKEADLVHKKDPITPEDVLGLEASTSGEIYTNA